MTFPILNDYKVAMANAKARFATLEFTPHLDSRRSPLFLAGNFAGVFKVEKPDGSHMAVKCFIRDLPHELVAAAAVRCFCGKTRQRAAEKRAL